MDPYTVLLIYLIFFACEFIFENGLTVLNIKHIRNRRQEIPEPFNDYIDEDHYKRSVDYSLTNERFSLFSAPLHAAFIIIVVLSGVLGTVNQLLLQLNLPDTIHGILYIFSISLLFTLFSLPFSLYNQFVIEERFGFNRMTLGLFFADLLKSLIISAVIAFPLLWGIFWLIDTAGIYWWIWAFFFLALFQLFMTVLYPLVIAPLFNKFEPLEDGPLKEKLNALADKLSFRAKGIYVMDGSKRSSHSNAYFTGFGKVKRIVLFDTLLRTLTETQITAVLAHELGHEKLKHVIKHFIISMLVMGTGLFIVHLLLGFEPLFIAFGFEGSCKHCLLVILGFCSGPFTFFLKPLLTAWSRKHEYEADRFAVNTTGQVQDLKEALISLTKENLSNLNPHPWYSFYHYSHPTVGERISVLDKALDKTSEEIPG